MSEYALEYVVPEQLEPGLWTLHLRFAPGPDGRPRVPPGIGLDNLVIGVLTDPGWPRLRARARDVLPEEIAVEIAVSPSVGLLESAHVFELVLVGVPNLAPGRDRAPFQLELDAPPPSDAPPAPLPTPIDYRNRDYAAFRAAMLSSIRVRVPGWVEESPADIGVALSELVAWAADQISAYQDTVATESTLATARYRASVRRHARLLDYTLHEGNNARVWLRFSAPERTFVPRGAATATPVWGDTPAATFLTLQDLQIDPERAVLRFFDWGVRGFVLKRGTTAAAVHGHHPRLARGDVLLATPSPSASEPPHPVRLIAAPLCLTDTRTGAAITRLAWAAEDALVDPLHTDGGACLLGNVVLADHGLPIAASLPPVTHEPYAPGVAVADPTWATEPPLAAEPIVPAARLRDQDPREAVPGVVLVELREGGPPVPWRVVRDLLSSGPTDRHFTVDPDPGHGLRLRFGDDVNGARPAPGTRFHATVRSGNGARGHVGTRTLTATSKGYSASNPVAGTGGREPEPLERGRRAAAHVWQTPGMLVTAPAYARAAEAFPLVAEAAARVGGAAPRVDVAVRSVAWVRPGPDWLARLSAALAPHQLMGTDQRVSMARPVDVELTLRVTLAPGENPEWVERTVLDALVGPGAPLDPERVQLGVAVELSALVNAVAAGLAQVPGAPAASDVAVLRFGRTDEDDDTPRATGVLPVAWDECARLVPEHLRVEMVSRGGTAR
jgi:hypothetical protein